MSFFLNCHKQTKMSQSPTVNRDRAQNKTREKSDYQSKTGKEINREM